MIVGLLVVFFLNAVSTCLGNLKTLFLSQQAIKPVYVATFLDAIVFAYAFKLIAASTGYGYIISFALGRLIGVFLANQIEKKLAFGLIEVTVFKHPEQGKTLADQLRCEGYSVTTTIGYGLVGKERLVLTIIIPRKKFAALKDTLEQDGKINMTVKPVTKTYGKVGSEVLNDTQMEENNLTYAGS